MQIFHPSFPYYDRPVLPVTVFLIIGILFGVHLPGFTVPVLILFLIVMIFMAVCVRRRHAVILSPLLATMAAGYMAISPWIFPIYGPDHIVHFMDTGRWRIHGVVKKAPVVKFGRTKTVLAVRTLSRNAVAQRVRGRIRLTVMGHVELTKGDRLTFSAKIRPFRNFRNPGGFDFCRYMAFQKIHGSSWAKAEAVLKNGNGSPGFFGQRIIDARKRLGYLIDNAGKNDKAEEKAVLKALVFGDRTGIDDGLRQRFNRAGAGHLLAISGLHVGIVAAFVFAGLRWIFAFLPYLLWRGWGVRWAAAATMVPVLAYGVLAGMPPSTQRAEIMVILFLIALIVGRTQDTLNTLAVAALVILVLFPPALFTISFQLSFAAVLSIIYGMEKIGRRSDERASAGVAMYSRIQTFFLVSILAVAGTTPVVLFHFNQTSMVGIVANLFLIPLVGFVAVPIGLLSAFVSLLAEPAAHIGFYLSLMVLKAALTGMDLFSRMPFASIKTVTPTLLEITLFYLMGWAVLNLRSSKGFRWVMVVVLAVVIADGLFWSHRRFWHRDLVATAIDVGQGGSTLLELPGGKVILYDGGGFTDNRFFDMGKYVVAPLLWDKKIASVDILVLSHPNSDHLNGLIYIAENFHVKELWTNGDANTTVGYRSLMETCRKKGIVLRRIDTDFGQRTMGPVTLTVLHPPKGFFKTSGPIEQERRNDGSIVLKAAIGDTAFLLTGDIEANAEHSLVKRSGENLASTVLFAPHHGSRTSNSSAWIAAVKPEVVVISAGSGNRYGFPHAEVLARYRQAGCRILSTATHGAVTIRSGGKKIDVSSYRCPTN